MIADKACYERGCACHDPRLDGDGVEVVEKREWVGLTEEEVIDLWPDLIMHRHTYQFWQNLEAKLKEKNCAN
jgi:hypothetical protein